MKRQQTPKQKAALDAGRAKAIATRKAKAAARSGVDMTGNAAPAAASDDPLAPKVTTTAYAPVPPAPSAQPDPQVAEDPAEPTEPASAPPAPASKPTGKGLEEPPAPVETKKPSGSGLGSWLKRGLGI